MIDMQDQLGRIVRLKQYPPKRIISLVPSQTELLHYFGLDEEVIGITKFCVHPKSWFHTKERVGGTKAVHIEKVRSLQPDLILANKEENVQEQIEALEQIAPVWISDVNNFEDALEMISAVGTMVDKIQTANTLIKEIQYAFSKLETPSHKPKACYLIWYDPYMTIGADTFINDMLNKCGFENVYADRLRYPTISLEDIKASGASYILLSSEPFPFKEKHAAIIREAIPSAKILFVDGEMFSWYGNRMLYAAQYFKELMNSINKPLENKFFA